MAVTGVQVGVHFFRIHLSMFQEMFPATKTKETVSNPVAARNCKYKQQRSADRLCWICFEELNNWFDIHKLA